MPDEYIKRDDALQAVWKRIQQIGDSTNPFVLSIRQVVREVPAADVAEVKHGRWVRATGMMPPEAFGVYECSLCGYTQDYHIPARMRKKTPYCPWCGAKLEGNDNADQ